MRLALNQHGDWRNIDNGKHGANWTFRANKTIRTAAAPAVAALMRSLITLVGLKVRRKWKVIAGSRGTKSAYTQTALGENRRFRDYYSVGCGHPQVAVCHLAGSSLWLVGCGVAFQPHPESHCGNSPQMVGDTLPRILRRLQNSGFCLREWLRGKVLRSVN